jgi:hypothetical protein
MICERRIGISSAHFRPPFWTPVEEASVNESPLTPTLKKTSDSFAKIWADEETLVADGRSQLTPSQHVEQKLIGMLKASPLMVSHVQRRLKPGPR